MTTASTAAPPIFRKNRFLQWICIGSIAAFLIASYKPDSTFDFFLENAAISVGVLMAAIAYRRGFIFSDLSYLLLFSFLCLHEWGAHFKYFDVPLGEWMKPLFHTQRNHFDRVAHFSFGLLFSYPMQEICMRVLKIGSRWRYYIPIECTLAFSAIYEMAEAGMAMILSPERGEEFVGMQGDIWDSQEDMFVALLGSIAAMIILAIMRKRRGSPKNAEPVPQYATAAKAE